MNETSTEWSRTTKYLVGIALVFFVIFILYISRQILPLLVIAALLSMVTWPVIRWLYEQGRVPRAVAVILVYLAVLIIFPVALLLAIPAIINAVQYVLSLDYQGLMRSVLDWLRATLESIQATQIPVGTIDAYVDQIITEVLASIETAAPTAPPQPPSVSTILQSLGAALTTTFSTVTSVVGAVVSNVVLLFFIILSSVYMSLGAHTYREGLLRALPAAYRPEISMLLVRIGRMWSAFFRGQLTLMLMIGVITWIGMTALGIPGALYLGIVAGLLELIPNLGPLIATIPAVIVALLQGSAFLPFNHLVVALLVIGFYVLVQQLENNLIVPRVLGDAVDLPPLVVITGVLVGTSVAGLLGALLATPLIATGRVIIHYIYAKLRGEDPYPPGETAAEPKTVAPSRLRETLQKWSARFARPRLPAPERQPPVDSGDRSADDHPAGDPEEQASPRLE